MYDAFDLSDPRVGVPLDPIPVFMTMRLDKALLRPARGDAPTRQGHRAIPARAAAVGLPRAVGLCRPCSAAARATVGPNTDADFGAFYYVLDGAGRVTIGSESAPIVRGDAIPLQLKVAKSFENTGTTPLELLVVGVASDPQKKDDLLVRRPPPRS